MANLKDIRRRIKSVKSTQKITQAMKMVAAAKVKRAENRVKANRPYAGELRLITREIYESLKNRSEDLKASRYGELLIDRPVKNVGIIVLTSDRGLCGSYNGTMLKQLALLEKSYVSEGLTPKFFLIGNKVIRSYGLYGQSPVLGSIGDISSAPTFQDANEIAKTMVQAFHDGKIDAIQILYTRFHSMISYKVTLQPLFPLRGLVEEIEHSFPPLEDAYAYHQVAHPEMSIHPETLLEPDPIAVLDQLIPLYLGNQIYNALLEGSASELAARMTAMSNASNNAAEMIGKLTIVYNKARQASITQEILEIVGGAEALK